MKRFLLLLVFVAVIVAFGEANEKEKTSPLKKDEAAQKDTKKPEK